MAAPTPTPTAAEAEAADWFARLGARTVSAQTLRDFQTWRLRPENASAYRRLESVWRDAALLRDDPEIRAATAAADRRHRARPNPRRLRATIPVAGALACLILAAVVWRPERGTYATDVGEQELVSLEDGSQVRLDTASRIRVRFDDGRRRVELARGQALFTIAPETSRPFIVEAGPARVTALGTVFAIRRDDAAATVTLVSGKVAVVAVTAPETPEQRLAAGQQAAVSARGQTIRAVDPAVQTSWTEGRLIFEETPLQAAVLEVNRYLSAPITLEAGSLRSVPVSGAFETGDREAFIAAASDLFDLKAVPSSDGSVMLRPENNSGAAPGSARR